MASGIRSEGEDVVVRLDVRRTLNSSAYIKIDGRLHKVRIADLVHRLAWGLVKEKAPGKVKDKTFVATQLDYDDSANEIIIRYTDRPVSIVLAPDDDI